MCILQQEVQVWLKAQRYVWGVQSLCAESQLPSACPAAARPNLLNSLEGEGEGKQRREAREAKGLLKRRAEIRLV